MVKSEGQIPSALVMWAGYGWWTAVGGAGGLGIAALLTFGVLLLLLAGAMGVIGYLIAGLSRRGQVWMVLVGGSAAPWYVAWLNRDGPGNVCQTSGGTTICSDQWSPLVFVVIAAFLMGSGIAGAVASCVRSKRARPRGA